MNEFIDKFLPFERELFFLLNGSNSTMLDNVMWTYTGLLTWMPMLVFILYIAFKHQKLKEGLLVILSVALVLVLCDQISSFVIKPAFKRFRPTHHPDYMNLVDIVRGYRGGRFGFISGHASNSFGLAVFFILLFRNRWVTIFMLSWAMLNSYTRIYLGVHFISDIIGGILLGSIIAIVVYQLYIWFRVWIYKIPIADMRKSIYSRRNGNILGVGIVSYILLVILLSPFLSAISHSIIPK